MSLPKPTTSLDQAESDLKTHGICLLANALSPAKVAELRGLLMRSIEQDAKKPPQNARFALDNGDLNRRVWNCLSVDQAFVDLVEDPRALRLVKNTIGWPALLGNISANVALPGAEAGVLHADQVRRRAKRAKRASRRPDDPSLRGEDRIGVVQCAGRPELAKALHGFLSARRPERAKGRNRRT